MDMDNFAVLFVFIFFNDRESIIRLFQKSFRDFFFASFFKFSLEKKELHKTIEYLIYRHIMKINVYLSDDCKQRCIFLLELANTIKISFHQYLHLIIKALFCVAIFLYVHDMKFIFH